MRCAGCGAARHSPWSPIASLAIGIGFNTALFTLVDALLFRPLPVERPDRLVDVFTSGGDGDQYATSSYPDFLDFKAQNQVFTDMLAYSPSMAAVKLTDRSRLAMGETVTGNYFQLLGVNAIVGRTLLPEDDKAGAPRAVVISHRLWNREYAASPSAVGQSIRIHNQPYTIVGVAPASFTGMVPLLAPEVWTPMAYVDEVEPGGIISTVPSPTGNTRLERRGHALDVREGPPEAGRDLRRRRGEPEPDRQAAADRLRRRRTSASRSAPSRPRTSTSIRSPTARSGRSASA